MNANSWQWFPGIRKSVLSTVDSNRAFRHSSAQFPFPFCFAVFSSGSVVAPKEDAYGITEHSQFKSTLRQSRAQIPFYLGFFFSIGSVVAPKEDT